jgi:GT2 family glycosyltransferase
VELASGTLEADGEERAVNQASEGGARVSAVVVTWNSLRHLPGLFGSLAEQTCGPIEVVAVDNGSSDGGAAWVREHWPAARVIENGANLGFCAANNQGIAASSGEFVLLVNTDVVLEPDFIALLVAELDADPGLGWASGKLLLGPAPSVRCGEEREHDRGYGRGRVIDSAGEVFFKTLRMVNRGQGDADRGQYDAREEVFGVTAAAALYRRAMLEDLRLGDDYFDRDFFSYLEDSDLNWRAQLRGWRCLYEPRAVAYHLRQHATRHPLVIQRHAHANRYLAILKNAGLVEIASCAPHLLVYEVHRLVKVLLRRPGLLPAYGEVLRRLPAMLRKRREVQRRRTIGSRAIRRWMAAERYFEEIRRTLGSSGRRAGGDRVEDHVAEAVR